MVKDEIARIKEEGLLVPTEPQDGAIEGQEGLVWEKGKVDVGRVQRFWWTAPPEGHPGGNDGEFSAFFFIPISYHISYHWEQFIGQQLC